MTRDTKSTLISYIIAVLFLAFWILIQDRNDYPGGNGGSADSSYSSGNGGSSE